jgi:T5SS/PEP-CTERM-associated repeat protein
MSTRLFPAAAHSVQPFKNRILSRWLGVCLALIVLPTSISPAEITATGDVDPADPATWTSSTTSYIGKTADGSLRVDAGSDLLSNRSYLGYTEGSTGEVTVDGDGSTWTNRYYLVVGDHGSGTLNITNGGAVSVAETTWVADKGDSTGTIVFGTNGGTLTTGSLCFSPAQLTGTGTINTRGLVSDVDLVFDAAHGLKQTFAINEPGRNITVNLDLSGTDGTAGDLGAGYLDSGSMVIRDGIKVMSRVGYIGFKDRATGVVTVDGAGSTWTNNFDLFVGVWGSGTLNISDGGLVSVKRTLYIDSIHNGDGFINMSTGGMLALKGDADDSLADFLGLIRGSDTIHYWDDSVAGWSDITNATCGEDYTLSYLTEGDLAGYTLLTVVPEPATLSLLILASVGLFRRR